MDKRKQNKKIFLLQHGSSIVIVISNLMHIQNMSRLDFHTLKRQDNGCTHETPQKRGRKSRKFVQAGKLALGHCARSSLQHAIEQVNGVIEIQMVDLVVNISKLIDQIILLQRSFNASKEMSRAVLLLILLKAFIAKVKIGTCLTFPTQSLNVIFVTAVASNAIMDNGISHRLRDAMLMASRNKKAAIFQCSVRVGNRMSSRAAWFKLAHQKTKSLTVMRFQHGFNVLWQNKKQKR